MAPSGHGSEAKMSDLETFQAALELKEPWFVDGSRFDATARRWTSTSRLASSIFFLPLR
jgi:hypothetical protein